MPDQIITCPECGNKIKVSINNSGNITAIIFVDDKKMLTEKICRKYGIELGVVESEVKEF